MVLPSINQNQIFPDRKLGVNAVKNIGPFNMWTKIKCFFGMHSWVYMTLKKPFTMKCKNCDETMELEDK